MGNVFCLDHPVYYAECRTQNTEFRPCIICRISEAEKKNLLNSIYFAVCSVTKVVVCYLLNKHVTTFIIIPHCQQTAEHSTCNSAKYTWSNSAFRIQHSAKYFHPYTLTVHLCIIFSVPANSIYAYNAIY